MIRGLAEESADAAIDARRHRHAVGARDGIREDVRSSAEAQGPDGTGVNGAGEERLSELLERQVRALVAAFDADDARPEISPPNWRILCFLGQQQDVSLRQLAEGAYLTVTNASRRMQKLVALGWVEMNSAPDSRRSYAINITPLGRQVHERAERIRAKELNAISGLSGDELRLVTRILGKCLDKVVRA